MPAQKKGIQQEYDLWQATHESKELQNVKAVKNWRACPSDICNLRQRIPKIHLRLSHPMNQRHEHLLLHPQELPHRFLHLGVLSPVPHLPQALIDPLGRVALFLR